MKITNKVSEGNGELTKKKHVTLDERPSSRSSTLKTTSSNSDIKNRYWKHFSWKAWQVLIISIPTLATNKSRPPAPLPYRPSSAGPPIHRHSSMRHLSMSQSHMADLLVAKKRFTPPPSMVNNSSISFSNYDNQFRQNKSSQNISDKVIFL